MRNKRPTEQAWVLAEIEAPQRARRVGDLLTLRLGLLLEWGFAVTISEGGAGVSLGALPVLTVLCESDPMNEDSVTSWVAERRDPGAFASHYISVDDKTTTGTVALEQLEFCLASLRQCADELATADIPIGWVSRGA